MLHGGANSVRSLLYQPNNVVLTFSICQLLMNFFNLFSSKDAF